MGTLERILELGADVKGKPSRAGEDAEPVVSGGTSKGQTRGVVAEPVEDDAEPVTDKQEYVPGDFYKNFIRDYSPYSTLSKGQEERERKRHERDARLAALGDRLNAFHQAFSHARGVKPMTDGTSLTGKVRERYEKLREERDAQRNEYLNAYLKGASLDFEQWRKVRDLERRAAETSMRLNEVQERINSLVSRGKMDEARALLVEAQTLYQNARTEGLRIDNKYKPSIAEATIRQKNAQAAKTGGGGRVGGYTTETEIHRDERGRETGRRTTRTPVGGQPVTTATQKPSNAKTTRALDNTPPSRRGNQDNTPPSRRNR